MTLGLGGNDAALILEDANLDDDTHTRMFWGAFASSGQICTALKRMHVHESRYDEVIDGFTTVCDRAVIGDGQMPETTMGPVNNACQLKVVTDMIADARATGTEVRACGRVPDEALYRGGGTFQKPALVFDADPALSVVKHEQFGPALPIVKVSTDDAVVAKANDSNHGLCASVWTEDPERAARIARQIEAGYLHLYRHGPMAQDARGPFGGFKLSGIRGDLGYDGVLGFADPHSTSGPAGSLLGEWHGQTRAGHDPRERPGAIFQAGKPGHGWQRRAADPPGRNVAHARAVAVRGSRRRQWCGPRAAGKLGAWSPMRGPISTATAPPPARSPPVDGHGRELHERDPGAGRDP